MVDKDSQVKDSQKFEIFLRGFETKSDGGRVVNFDGIFKSFWDCR